MNKHTNYGSFYKKEDPKKEPNKTNESKKEEGHIIKEELPKEEVKEPVKVITEKASDKARVVKALKVNMRFKPNKSSPVINIVPKNAIVKVINSENGEWWKISYRGITGYMMSRFLEKE